MPSIPLTGTGGFFPRQGTIIGEFNRVAALYGSALTNGWQSIMAQFASSDQSVVTNIPGAAAQYAQSGLPYQQTLAGDGQAAILAQVSDFTSVVPPTVPQALLNLIAQMKSTAQTVNKPTLSTSVVAGGSNQSDATIVLGVINPFGDQLDMTIAEAITVTCVAANTAYQESLQAVGQAQQPATSGLWPGGSGANLQFNVTDAASTNQIAVDGGFANWTNTNTPVNWTWINGTPGVTIFQAANGVRGATATSAKLLSDGSSLTQFVQTISVQPNTVYAVSFDAQVSALDASGQVVIQFTDENGHVVTNDQGANLSLTVNTNGQITASGWNKFTAFFSTPRLLPVITGLQIGFSTAMTAAKFLLLDLVGVVQASQLYPGGPNIVAWANANRTAPRDNWTVTVNNNLSSKSFVMGSLRLYNFPQLGNNIYYPSSNSPTIPDSLVTN